MLVDEGFLYANAGKVWQRTPEPGLDVTAKAASAGGGVRLSIGAVFSAFVEVAKPFNTIVGQDTNRNARVYAGVTMR